MAHSSGAAAFPELFRMVPGMDVARIDGNKWAISTRGFNQRFQDKLLVQLDGRTVYTPAFSGVYWDTVDYPLEDIERIEIIRGPGASVWGANAVNGIINIITKSASDTQGGFVSGGVGTTEQGFGTFRYGGKVGENLFYRHYGKGFTRDQTFAEVGDPHDGWSSGSGGLRLDWKPSEQTTMTFDGSYLRNVAGRRDERAQTNAPLSFLNLENEITDAGHVLGRWTRQLDEENNWSVQGYWDHFSRLADNLPVRLGHLRRGLPARVPAGRAAQDRLWRGLPLHGHLHRIERPRRRVCAHVPSYPTGNSISSALSCKTRLRWLRRSWN